MKRKSKNKSPKIFFTHNPKILVYENYYSLHWEVENALFVRISGGIGLKKTKGSVFVPNKDNKVCYKLTAFGFKGVKSKIIELEYIFVNKRKLIPVIKTKSISLSKELFKNKISFSKKVKLKERRRAIKYKNPKIHLNTDIVLSDLKKIQEVSKEDELTETKKNLFYYEHK